LLLVVDGNSKALRGFRWMCVWQFCVLFSFNQCFSFFSLYVDRFWRNLLYMGIDYSNSSLKIGSDGWFIQLLFFIFFLWGIFNFITSHFLFHPIVDWSKFSTIFSQGFKYEVSFFFFFFFFLKEEMYESFKWKYPYQM